MINDYIVKDTLACYLMQYNANERIKELYNSFDKGDLDDFIRLYTTYSWDAAKMVQSFLSQDEDAEDDIMKPKNQHNHPSVAKPNPHTNTHLSLPRSLARKPYRSISGGIQLLPRSFHPRKFVT